MTEQLLKDLNEHAGLNEKEANELVEYVSHNVQISVANLRLKFRWGFARSGRAMDQLEKHGIVSNFDGTKPRTVLVKRS